MGRMPTPPAGTPVTWQGDLVPPVTSYAASRDVSPLSSRSYIPPSTNRTNSAVVTRVPRRNGIAYFYSHGGLTMPANAVPRPGSGGVWSSSFQQVLVQLHDWVKNSDWFAAGYPRNLGYAFRVQQVSTKAGGGSVGRMQPRPLFPKVQVIPRATVVPPAYKTRSSNS